VLLPVARRSRPRTPQVSSYPSNWDSMESVLSRTSARIRHARARVTMGQSREMEKAGGVYAQASRDCCGASIESRESKLGVRVAVVAGCCDRSGSGKVTRMVVDTYFGPAPLSSLQAQHGTDIELAISSACLALLIKMGLASGSENWNHF
jgi:hypothetical protein